MSDTTSKVTPSHLRRDAYLYVRQSTLYQVANNTESTRRQYDLRGRAIALGWPAAALAIRVLPVPGGPTMSTPRGGVAPARR